MVPHGMLELLALAVGTHVVPGGLPDVHLRRKAVMYIRHAVLFKKVAERMDDPDILRVLRLMLTIRGNKGIAQGDILAPLQSNVSLPQVDRMGQRAQAVTRRGAYTHGAYARFADDLVILVDGHRQQDGLCKAGEPRLREELATLHVTLHEDKSRLVDLVPIPRVARSVDRAYGSADPQGMPYSP